MSNIPRARQELVKLMPMTPNPWVVAYSFRSALVNIDAMHEIEGGRCGQKM